MDLINKLNEKDIHEMVVIIGCKPEEASKILRSLAKRIDGTYADDIVNMIANNPNKIYLLGLECQKNLEGALANFENNDIDPSTWNHMQKIFKQSMERQLFHSKKNSFSTIVFIDFLIYILMTLTECHLIWDPGWGIVLE